MNWADFVIVGVIVLSALISLWRGFMREAISLATWIAAFWLATGFSSLVAIRLQQWVHTPSLRMITAFAILFVLALLVGAVVNHFVGLAIQKTGLSGTDRFIGLFFGAARGIVVVALMVMIGTLAGLSRDPWWQNSGLIPYAQPVADWMRGFLPDRYAKDLPEARLKVTPGE